MTTTLPSKQVIDRIVERFLALDFDAVLEYYADDVFCDLNVPQWRVQIEGRDQLSKLIHSGYPVGSRLASSRVTPTGDGVVIEVEVRFPEDGEERMFRELHLLRLADDQVVEHTSYCTGHWDAATIARHAEEVVLSRP